MIFAFKGNGDGFEMMRRFNQYCWLLWLAGASQYHPGISIIQEEKLNVAKLEICSQLSTCLIFDFSLEKYDNLFEIFI